MTDDLRRLMTVRALEIGSLLNTIVDDDERERVQQHFEEVLNDELWAGSQNRRVVAPLHAALRSLGLRPLNEIHSIRVTEEDFAALSDGPVVVDIHSRKERL